MGLAYLITSDRLQLLCERKVLKEAEYSALLDSARLIETVTGSPPDHRPLVGALHARYAALYRL